MRNKGITLIALIITIIVLLILAGITLAILTGENGIITNALETKEETVKASIDEQFKLAQLAAKTEKQGGKITADNVINELIKQGQNVKKEDENTLIIDDKYVYEIREVDGEVEWEDIGTVGKVRPGIESVEVTNRTTGSITVAVETKRNEGGTLKYYIKEEDKEYTFEVEQTGEEYTFILDPNTTYTHIKVEAIAKNGEITVKEIDLLDVPSLKEEHVTFTYMVNGREITEKQWTQGPITVLVTVDKKFKGYTLQYTTEDPQLESNWKTYKTGIEFQDKGKLYVRLYDTKLKEAGGKYSKEVVNIDTIAPEITNIQTTVTTNSLTITADITDADSGVAECYFSKDGGITWEPENKTTPNSYTFSGLKQNTAYDLKIKAIDKVGNEKITEEKIDKNTESVPTPIDKNQDSSKGNITFTYSATELTKDDVTVDIAIGDPEKYTIQYTTGDPSDESSWGDYGKETSITMTQNGNIYVRLKDKTGQVGEYTTINIDNIDKLSPNDFVIPDTLSTTYTWNSITVKAATTDKATTDTNACSGIYGYRFRLEGGEWSEWKKGETCEYTFNGLTPDIEYTIEVETKDTVGNPPVYGTIKTTIRDTTAPVISTLEATSTSRSITLKGTVVEEESGIAKCEFSKDGGKNWVTPSPATSTTYPFDGLDQNTTFNLQMRVTDHSGNVSEVKSVSKATIPVSSLATANIILSPDIATATNDKVEVTIQNPSGGNYTIQYTTKDPTVPTNWNNYTEGTKIPFTENGYIHARLWDGKNAGAHASVNICNIDKLAPNPLTLNATSTPNSNSITVTASTTDPADSKGYPGSGIVGYSFSINGGAWTNWQTSGQNTFSNLAPGTYTIRAKAIDKVGHESDIASTSAEVISLSLASTNGTALSGGNSKSVTINGGNYGTLSCTINPSGVATASISGNNTLVVSVPNTTSHNKSATITVNGKNGASATYTITSHMHQGNDTTIGGCYGPTVGGNRPCNGTRTAVPCGRSLTTSTCGGSLTASPSNIQCTGKMTCYACTPAQTSDLGVSFYAYYTCPSCNHAYQYTTGFVSSDKIEAIRQEYLNSTIPCTNIISTQEYKCSICNTKYSSAGTCTKVTGYECTFCNKKYSSAGTCTTITGYKCNLCGNISNSLENCTVPKPYYAITCGIN